MRVYRLSNNNWNQLGEDIDRESAHDSSGCAVSLSADGTTLAVGAWGNDANGSDSGHVHVYRLTSTVVLGKPSSQSSTSAHFSAKRANDGSIDTFSHTIHNTNNPWWEVDLVDSYAIQTIKVINRGGCCGDRLNGFQLNVFQEGSVVFTYQPPARQLLNGVEF